MYFIFCLFTLSYTRMHAYALMKLSLVLQKRRLCGSYVLVCDGMLAYAGLGASSVLCELALLYCEHYCV